MSEQCEHLSSIVEDNTYDGFAILRCTWGCGQTLIELDLGNHHVATYTAAELAQLRAAVGRLEGERQALREACEKIKAKSEMWQQVAQSTASAKAIPPWWNLGYIAAAALEKAAALAADGERGTG
jgi:hypothetical protein